jgi:cytochrome c biogenesis protein CcmG/thiol:disulfide interchange protein DsbE
VNKRLAIFLLPLALFGILVVFLFQGLGSDASKLESVLVGKTVPEFTLEDLITPEHHYQSSLFKGEPLLLNVWATWCPTCRAEHAFLNQLAGNGVKIVGLNYKDDRSKAINWLRQLGDPYRVNLYDGKGLLGLDLGVYGAPETFFIDSQGVIRYRHVGDINASNWRAELAAIYAAME